MRIFLFYHEIDTTRKQIFKGILLFYLEIIYCVYSLELPYLGIYANFFTEKMWVAFAFAKATHIFLAKVTVD